VRDIPDVSLFAANGVWGHYYVICWSDAANGGASCSGAPSGWAGAGGTSFSSPIMAGIQALVNQMTGSKWGNPNPVYYQLAASEYGSSGNPSCNSTSGNSVGSSCIFYDVTQGDMDVNCTGTNNCYRPSGTNGVLSTSSSSYSKAYGTTTGWDFATGIGTVNAYNLATNWNSGVVTPPSSIAISGVSSSSVTLLRGGSASLTVNLTRSNFAGSVTLSTSTLPTGVTATYTQPGTGNSGTISLKAVSTAALVSNQSITISASGSGVSASATFSLTVTTPTIAISSVSPSSVTLARGGSASLTVNLTRSNFTGSVTLSTSGLPTGVTATYAQPVTRNSGTISLKAASNASLVSSRSITITAKGSGVSSTTATFALTVNSFAIRGH